jgi:hypothetical protein
VGGVWLLPCNFKDVAEAVPVESAHGREVGGEAFGVTGFQLLDEELYVGGDDFVRRSAAWVSREGK